MAMKMAAHGTSEMIVEIRPVPITKTQMTRFVLVPALAIIHNANRRANPVFIHARAMINIDKTKKTTGPVNSLAAGPSDLMPRIGWRIKVSRHVTAIGNASVDHNTSPNANTAAVLCASGDIPAGVGA